MLSDIGGLYQSLNIIAALIVGLFSDKLFYSHMISDIY